MATEYISRKAAYESLNRIKSYLHQQHSEYSTMMFWEVEDFIETLPAADVVEVVRCKDCKYYTEGKLLGPTKFCYYYQIGTGLNTADDDFCSKGERMVDNG